MPGDGHGARFDGMMSHLQNSRKDEFQESQISKTPENQGLLELVLPILRGFARGSDDIADGFLVSAPETSRRFQSA